MGGLFFDIFWYLLSFLRYFTAKFLVAEHSLGQKTRQYKKQFFSEPIGLKLSTEVWNWLWFMCYINWRQNSALLVHFSLKTVHFLSLIQPSEPKGENGIKYNCRLFLTMYFDVKWACFGGLFSDIFWYLLSFLRYFTAKFLVTEHSDF